MTKIDAVAFSWAGDKFLGVPYSEMDCQEFVERCMRECGMYMDLGGSNSWYREIMKHGWVGTPEECMKLFGQIPKGAILFIREEVGQGTPGKFRTDGIGDITHMGIRTGRGEGAIHSSSSRGGVVESKFKDKTIPNGGWNRVGLYDRIDYGKSINWYLEHIGIGEKPEKGEMAMKQVVVSDNGNPVNLRAKKDMKSARLAKVPVGEEVEVFGTEGLWSRIKWNGITGWMMTEYLITDDSEIPAENPEDFTAEDADDQDGSDQVALYFTVEELAALLPILEKMTDQIIKKVGRG